MPRDDASRRTARERSQARVSRYSGGSATRSSTDPYGRAQQESEHLSQARYTRQAPRQANQSSREAEGAYRRQRQEERTRHADDRRQRSGRPEGASGARDSRSSRSSGGSRSAGRGRAPQQQSRRAPQGDRRSQQRSGQRQGTRTQATGIAGVIEKLPSFAVPAAIALVALIVIFALIFGVLAPSCSKNDDAQVSQDSSSGPSVTVQAGLVSTVAQAKKEKQTAVETVNQVGNLETSNTTVQALVELLGEEEAAKLIAQAKTNSDALWIAAHPDAYAFDGIEIQYKILKLAADEPAAISYVREFPAKYPMNEAVADKELAMDVASPSTAVPTTSTPHLYQWDRRWAYTVYSSASFGLTGCGPTSLAMVYQGLKRTVDRTPFDMAVLAEERGYMSEFNGTDSAFFIDIAPELGLNCWEAYPDADNIREELRNGHVIIANLGPGYFTTNGHFFVLAGLTDDGQVIVNDPYSVVRSSQTWDADFIAAETMAMFVYSAA